MACVLLYIWAEWLVFCCIFEQNGLFSALLLNGMARVLLYYWIVWLVLCWISSYSSINRANSEGRHCLWNFGKSFMWNSNLISKWPPPVAFSETQLIVMLLLFNPRLSRWWRGGGVFVRCPPIFRIIDALSFTNNPGSFPFVPPRLVGPCYLQPPPPPTHVPYFHIMIYYVMARAL